MSKRHLLLALALAGLCGPAAWAKQPTPGYYEATLVDSIRFMAPPPSAEVSAREIEQMLELQRLRTPEQVAKSAGDLEQSVFRFADVLGAQFNEERLPKATIFFHRLYKTESALNKQGKAFWKRPRPPLIDARIQPITEFGNGASYPSGHAAFGYLTGIVLADMLPEMRPQIMTRAREFGDNRVLGGVHYPSDVEAGRQLAVLIAALVQHRPDFQADFTSARAEIRELLNLP
ncbi:MAG: phosphatase PAP2 family protein [Alcaligenaceae bacterium]|nr:MAG: phosphatase PAP2 family protein [Alcaligenaceae bacterium]